MQENATVLPERVFLGWGKPVVESVVERLLQNAPASLPDLSGTLVVVPTKHAGRRLRAALAERCPAGLLAPKVVPPEFFLGLTGEEAGRAATLLAWTEVLAAIDLSRYSALFPALPVERNFSWALGVAELVESARATLAEGGKTPADAATTLPDPARWADIRALESKVVARLEKRGMKDAQSAKVAAAAGAALPPGVGRIVLAAVPDALHLAEVALARHFRAGVPVEVWVAAPGELGAGFDAWGRPDGRFWGSREVEIPHFDTRVFLSPDPAGQAARAGDILRSRKNPESRAVALGCIDPDVAPPLSQVLGAGGVETFVPDGEPLDRDPLFRAFAAFSNLLSDGRWESFRELIRQPPVLDGLARVVASQGGDDLFEPRRTLDRTRILRAFDALYDLRLPATFEAVRWAVSNPLDEHEFKRRDYAMPTVVGEVGTLMNTFRSQGFASGVREFVRFLGRENEIADRFIAVADEVVGYLDAGPKKMRSTNHADILAFCVRLLAGERVYPARPAGPQVDLLGWLELLWEDAPDLVIAGFNEGHVPDSVVGDPFLPETARETLGLRTNAERFARDAYVLEALARQRDSRGKVDIILGKVALDGTPLKPSRLLFLCPDSGLVLRTQRLFGPPEQAGGGGGSVPAWERSWLFRPPATVAELGPMPYLRVTHFSSYLACPFRFFLKNRLRMEPVEFEKEEMDARDFGTVVHLALEALYHEGWARESTDVKKLRDLLADALDTAVAERYGPRLPTPLAMQREVAQQRLGRVAEIQAAERGAGWVIEAVEHDFGSDPEWGSSLAGIPVHGSIDRIERHDDGRVRILDYKTSKVAVSPEDAHLRPLPQGAKAGDFPDWRMTTGSGGKPRLWTNLQLPLYVLWARAHYPGATSVSPGYFNIPAALGNSGISTWDAGHFGSVIGPAEACTAAVGEAVRSNVFWPPEARVTYDDFSVLAPVGTLGEAVDAEAWQAAFTTLPKP